MKQETCNEESDSIWCVDGCDCFSGLRRSVCAISGRGNLQSEMPKLPGAAGLADTSAGKAIKVKPVTDPSVKKLTEAEMVAATHNGMGKMQPYKDKLSDAENKGAVDYFRTFLK
jgi:hypothetical protein